MLMIKVGLESQVACHKTIRLIRTKSKGAKTYAKKLSIAIWSINYDWQSARRTHEVGLVVPAPTALQSVYTDSLPAK